ncbi:MULTISPECIES: 4-hydroxy-tetrahydrodipicolinate synthase [unclassified Adlercreutzia]|uniref:4-hydroxy-tetrahydrodipicolinate synthase n=1 Tax=unclassified Adlercreutzia TaxID=2636013 RepID=UPI0013EC4CAE|nr:MULTISPECIES: 4-hydroxy-tetrahydrodipicolinate synthase [unclassified Adlercreutzia]
MSQLLFGRMIPAMITPFDEMGNVDLKTAEALADRLIAGGADSLLVCATTGESPTVSHAEKMDLFRTVAEVARGRVPVIANVGGNCTSDSIALAREVQGIGVDGFLCVVPYYNKPPQEGMYQHFGSIARSVDLPVVLYNIPGRCVVNMQADTTIRLARDFDNIVGVKECSGDMDQVGRIARETPEHFNVYSGDDASTCEIMKQGGVGVISTTGNVAPARMKEIVELCASGDWDAAKRANERLLPLMEGLFETSNPILVKEALRLLGFPVGGVRLPLVRATRQQSERLADVMREVGIL